MTGRSVLCKKICPLERSRSNRIMVGQQFGLKIYFACHWSFFKYRLSFFMPTPATVPFLSSLTAWLLSTSFCSSWLQQHSYSFLRIVCLGNELLVGSDTSLPAFQVCWTGWRPKVLVPRLQSVIMTGSFISSRNWEGRPRNSDFLGTFYESFQFPPGKRALEFFPNHHTVQRPKFSLQQSPFVWCKHKLFPENEGKAKQGLDTGLEKTGQRMSS